MVILSAQEYGQVKAVFLRWPAQAFGSVGLRYFWSALGKYATYIRRYLLFMSWYILSVCLRIIRTFCKYFGKYVTVQYYHIIIIYIYIASIENIYAFSCPYKLFEDFFVILFIYMFSLFFYRITKRFEKNGISKEIMA